MFFTKSVITLLSSIGASSIPLVSVIVLYKIKSFSRGELEAAAATNGEENVISEVQPTVVVPEVQVPEEKQESQKSSEAEKTPKPEPVPPQPKPSQKPEQTKSRESNTQNAEKAVVKPTPKPDTNTPTVIEPAKTANEIVAELNKIAQEIIKRMTEKTPQTNNDGNGGGGSNIDQDIDLFIKLLETKLKTINNDAEKNNAQTVIQSLKTLKGKISKVN